MSIISNIIFNSIKKDTPLNILSFFYDGRFDIELLKTGHNFYGVLQNSAYKWPGYNKIDYPNLHLINQQDIGKTPFNLIIFNKREAHYQVYQLCQQLHVPGLIIDHDFCYQNPFFLKKQQEQTFLPSVSTDVILGKQFNSKEIIHYAIDDIEGEYNKDIDILLCGNFIDKDLEIVHQLKQTFPSLQVCGHNPQLPYSIVVPTYEDYKDLFKRTRVFINLPSQSNINYDLLLALKYKCAIISTNIPIYKNLLKDGVNVKFIGAFDEIFSILKTMSFNQDLLTKLTSHTTDLSQYNNTNFDIYGKWSQIFQQYAGIFK